MTKTNSCSSTAVRIEIYRSVCELLSTLRSSSTTLFISAVALTLNFAPSTAHAQDVNLGSWESTTFANGNTLTLRDFPDSARATVYRQPDGRIYIYYVNDGKVWPPSNSSTNVSGQAQAVVQPSPPAGTAMIFSSTVEEFIENQLATLTSLIPAIGVQFFALELPDSIQSLGNTTSIWGDFPTGLPTSTFGVLGFSQNLTTLSVLASSTSDGQNPVRFDFDPSSQGFEFDFSLSNGVLATAFAAGSIYSSNTISTDYALTGRVSEPSSIALVLSGIMILVANLKRRYATLTPS